MSADEERFATLGALVLSGGASRRMGGRPKALLEVDGRPQILRLIEDLQTLGLRQIRVVTGAHHDVITPVLAGTGVLVVQNPDWAEGMGASLRTGVASFEDEPESLRGLLVTPVDLLGARADDWRALCMTFLDTGLVAATQAEDGPGAPAVFPRRHWPVLAGLQGDRGARDWLRQHPEQVRSVNLPGLQIDTDQR